MIPIPEDPSPPDILEALVPIRRRRTDARSRRRLRGIEEALRESASGMTAQEVADAVGRHHTGVRARLAELERAGLVEARLDPPAGRGRPPRRFSLAPDAADREAAGHRELVRLLMRLVRGAGFGPAEVERFGERQGAGIVRPGRGIREVEEVLDRLGFAPCRAAAGGRAALVLRRCPFADGVESPSGHLICLLHRGLARGMLRQAAPGAQLIDLEIRVPRRAGCLLHLSPRVTRRSGGA